MALLLTLLPRLSDLASRLWLAILALVSKTPAWVWLVLVLGAWGWHGHRLDEQAKAKAAADQLAAAHAATLASETARQREQQLTAKVLEISDELNKTQAARDAASRSAAERLRMLAEAQRTRAADQAALAACRSYDGPTVAVLHDSTRNALVDLARDADEVADNLRACQRYVREVVQPGSTTTK